MGTCAENAKCIWEADKHPPQQDYALKNQNFAAITLTLHVKRDWRYYISHFVVPTWLVVILSFSLFWFNVDGLSDRIGVVTSVLITLVGFNAMLNDALPKTGSMTRMHFFMSLSLGMIVAAGLESLLVYADKDARAPVQSRSRKNSRDQGTPGTPPVNEARPATAPRTRTSRWWPCCARTFALAIRKCSSMACSKCSSPNQVKPILQGNQANAESVDSKPKNANSLYDRCLQWIFPLYYTGSGCLIFFPKLDAKSEMMWVLAFLPPIFLVLCVLGFVFYQKC